MRGQFTPVSGGYPRLRGRPVAETIPVVPAGAIPACAGSTDPCSRCRSAGRSYPRLCGVAYHTPPISDGPRELSPLARGRLGRVLAARKDPGAIPACAGPTGRWPRGGLCRPNYPRVRGADTVLLPVPASTADLSPRAGPTATSPSSTRCVRSMPAGRWSRRTRPPSAIPACVGPSSAATTSSRSTWSYPRGRRVDNSAPATSVIRVELSPACASEAPCCPSPSA